MATIGYRAAVADAFGMKFTGLIPYGMWMFIHMLYLVGWGNRLGTVYTWLRALVFTKNRGHRIIKTNNLAIVPLSIEDAAQRLEDSKNEFIVFRDMDTDRVSVIYKRRDNNLGLIAPEV